MLRELEDLGLDRQIPREEKVLATLTELQQELHRVIRPFEIEQRCPEVPRGSVSAALYSLKLQGLVGHAGVGRWYAKKAP